MNNSSNITSPKHQTTTDFENQSRLKSGRERSMIKVNLPKNLKTAADEQAAMVKQPEYVFYKSDTPPHSRIQMIQEKNEEEDQLIKVDSEHGLKRPLKALPAS